MTMKGSDWAAKQYAVIVPDPTVLSPAEQTALMNKLTAMGNANVAYLEGAVVVNPTALSVPALGLTFVPASGGSAPVAGTANVAGTGTIS